MTFEEIGRREGISKSQAALEFYTGMQKLCARKDSFRHMLELARDIDNKRSIRAALRGELGG